MGKFAVGSLVFIFVTFNLCFGAVPQDRLQVFTWNLQNLYDTEHDENRNDWTYLPLQHPLKKKGCLETVYKSYQEECLKLDWTPQKLQLKYRQIKKMVDSVGPLPDILAVTEIENEKVLRDLAKVLGYKHWTITRTDDERGVDQGLLFNEKPGFRFIKSQDIAIPLNSLTRPILQSTFEFHGHLLNVYVNHWPAIMAPAFQRMIAAQALLKGINDFQNRHPQRQIYTVALGDFNISEHDNPQSLHVLQHCQSMDCLVDLDAIARRYVSVKPDGTYFFIRDMKWQLLDRIFLSRNFFLQKELKLPVNRYKIVTNHAYNYVSRPDPVTGKIKMMAGIPHRYNHQAYTEQYAGFSDHFPLMFDVVLGSAR